MDIWTELRQEGYTVKKHREVFGTGFREKIYVRGITDRDEGVRIASRIEESSPDLGQILFTGSSGNWNLVITFYEL